MATPKKNTKGMDGAAAFERFLPQTLNLTRVLPLKADATLALKNVTRGVDALMRHEIRIRRELPKVDVKALRALPDLARAVVYAAAEAERAGPQPKQQDIPKLLARARTLRDLLLASAESLATAGVFPSNEVAKIREGLGPLDSARDCVALAALFRRHAAAVKGKTPVKADLVDETERLGADLVERLEARKAPRPPTSLASALAARDKLWTLLVRRHDILWRAGAYVIGRNVDKFVPGLQHTRAPRKNA